MATFVLVPGAWLGRWVWERVAPLLQSSGHSVHPITLPGLAGRADELSPAVGLMAHVNDLLSQCKKLDLHDAVLVGHSHAGAVVGGAARRSPGMFRAQVYLDTMPLDEGRSLLDGFSPNGKAKWPSLLEDRNGTKVWPVPEPLSAQAPTEGLSAEDLELLRSRGTPQPALTFEERLTGPVETGPYPRSHAISCVEDEQAGIAEKEEFLSKRPDWSYRSLPICHWPMLSSPEELASALVEISQV